MADFFVIPQGTLRDVTGTLRELLIGLHQIAIDRLQNPNHYSESAVKFHQANVGGWYIEHNVAADRRPSLGYEQYEILPDGTLGPMLENWDSSD